MAIPTQYQNGATPILAEPLHQYERSGLQTLGGSGVNQSMTDALGYLQQMNSNPTGFAGRYTDPRVSGYMDSAAGATQAGINPVTMQEIQGVQNPYASALKNRLTEYGQQARAGILANQGVRGGRSFGDTAQGVRQGMLDNELLSKSSDIDYQTFQDALGQINTERNRSLTGGAQFGNLANGAQGIFSSAMQNGLASIGGLYNAGAGVQGAQNEAAGNQIDAGNYIRTYNQGINDLVQNNLLQGQGYPAQQISNVTDWLKYFQSGTGGAQPGANSLSTAGGLAQVGGGLLSMFGGGSRPVSELGLGRQMAIG